MIYQYCPARNSERNRGLFLTLLRILEKGASLESWHRLFFPWLYNPEFISDKDAYKQLISYCLSYPYHQTIESFRSQLSRCVEYDFSSSLKEIESPTLTVCGDRDILITPSESIKMGELIKNNELKIPTD